MSIFIGLIIAVFSWDEAGDLPFDRVRGYTIRQIQECIYNAHTWHDWRRNLEDIDPSNPTRIYLEELFNNWEFNE